MVLPVHQVAAAGMSPGETPRPGAGATKVLVEAAGGVDGSTRVQKQLYFCELCEQHNRGEAHADEHLRQLLFLGNATFRSWAKLLG